jgi:hypothetical protein
LSDTKSENMIINQKHNTVQLIVDKHGWWFNVLNLMRDSFYWYFWYFGISWYEHFVFKIMKLIYHYLFIDVKQDHFSQKEWNILYFFLK